MVATDGFPDEIRVISRSANIRGHYVRHRKGTVNSLDVPEGVDEPIYRIRRTTADNGSSNFICRREGAFQLTVGGFKRIICSTEKDANDDPTKIVEQPKGSEWSKTIARIEAVDHSHDGEKTDAPAWLEIHSKHKNLKAGLRRQPGDTPAWASDSGDLHLWYSESDDSWHLTSGPPSAGQSHKAFAVVAAHESMDPRHGDWHASDGSVDCITAVWWKEEKEKAGWTDPAFPPTNASIGYPASSKDATWIRATDLDRDRSQACLFDVIEPSDLQQGHLGDCWLLAATAAVAQYPEKIAELFPEGADNLPTDGKHKVKLYNIVTSKWEDIVIDDFIPCKPRRWFEQHAEPLFSKPAGSEMWVLLLEKAFAKLWGGYHKLKGGRACFAWQALTGVEEQQVIVREGSEWVEYEIDLEEQIDQRKSGAPQEFPLCRAEDGPIYDADSLWKKVKHGCQQGNVLAATFEPKNGTHKDVEENGLMANHAYSILKVQSVKEPKLHFIQLRNPFGSEIEWNGAWSDHDDANWGKYPQVGRELGFEASDDGTFFMLFDDFMKEYDTVSICPCALKDSASVFCGKSTSAKRLSSLEVERDTYEPEATNCSDRCVNSCTLQ